ncbi:4-hydroxy-3-methylbut-2-en-1-yl diphosphate synthase [Alloprevotella sp. OH1205_COT-284]|uniref:4-hydroxy-3-methylbut-2-en-1-yl diphosphate synthase n=1 Tax=Alloprevotella sp. OH1205_COT-284 TaxID=2491043 RepID=UPI000F5F03D0|nr:4-hydroxy-3-methylbut-2-en-1-yl diphosphate synthase [Alloprevotella sp. OH1205_COT-284]RRD80845.1 4-hydroxy-3-methylbut-2-en-1-yl diphosphate synthase [Alloprevotella sp. OH1205_COT-284]
MDLFNYNPRPSHEVSVGNTPLGGGKPLRLQSMTTTLTTDTEASVEQCIRIIEAGADYIRLTTQGKREAENLRNIREELRRRGYNTPLVADVHFNPNVADVAATIVEKVRINPGNYVDPARTFKSLEYTPEEYAAELERLEARFRRLLDICKTHGTALRIGVNHGSLSDRIMCHYGDTPAGIVESCMEFLRVCVKEDFRNAVVSIKASNTVVMVESMRLLVDTMRREGMTFPLHLGVTEAGEGEDGRIKSAVGIGALLADGIGDTIRVSLSEAPEAEIPVAYQLAAYVLNSRSGHNRIPASQCPLFDWLRPQRRPTCPVLNIGGTHAPVVVSYRADARLAVPSATPSTPLPDYAYFGDTLPSDWRKHTASAIVDAPSWTGEAGTFPAYTPQYLMFVHQSTAAAKFLFLSYAQLNDEVKACLRVHPEMVVIAQSHHANRSGELRALVHEMGNERLTNPIIFCQQYGDADKEGFQIKAAADTGVLMFDGFTDGLMLASPLAERDETAFAILQAGRLRMTKTEYISCPGCGRTLYDLPGTIARIKAATSHLKGLKIGIMGCIVNGPGEMADADYGYVGAAPGKVSLYRGKTCVERNIPTEDAVDRLLRLIETDQAKNASPSET